MVEAGLKAGENIAEAWRTYHQGNELTSAQQKIVVHIYPDHSINKRWWAG